MKPKGLRRALAQLGPLFRRGGVFLASNVANRAVPFLLLPVLTRYLSPADFGVVAMYTVALNLAVPLIGLSTESAVARQYFERDTLDFPRYVGNCLYIMGATVLLLAAVFAVAGPYLAAALAIPVPWLWTILLLAAAKFLTVLMLVLWQVQGRPLPYAALAGIQTLLAAGLSVWLIVGEGMDWRGRVLGDLVAYGLTALAAVALLARGRMVRGGPERSYLTHALKFGGGLLPHMYGALLIVATDRFFVTHMIGVDATGVFAAGAQIGMIIGVLEHSFNQAWVPWIYERLKRRDPADPARIRKITRAYNVGIVLIALGLAAIAPWFVDFFLGSAFAGAAGFILWFALGNAFSGMYKMVVNQIFYANRTHILGLITLATGLLNVALNYVLILLNGAVGAAQGTALALLFSYLATAWYSRRVMRAHYAPVAEPAPA